MLHDQNLIPAILLLGVSNSGKSTLINWILSSAAETQDRRALRTVAVRDTLQSTTNVVEEVSISYKSPSGIVYEAVLVDTPGLDHSSLTNQEVVQKIAEWFNNQKRKTNRQLRVSSILYCHDISADFVNPTMRLDLEVLSQFCGLKAMSLVTFVTLKWDQLNRPVLGDVREAEMERRFWTQTMHGLPCAVRRIKDQHDATRLLAMIIERMEELAEPPLLQIQSDLEESNGDWSSTQAARCLDPSKKRKKSDKALGSWWKALHVLAPRNTDPPLEDGHETEGSVDPVLDDGKEGDLIILVMGEVHAGKSTFLRQLSGIDNIEVGTKLTPCTRQVRGVIGTDKKCEPAGRRLIFVDTPGLDGSTSTLHRIANWLRQSYKQKMSVGGVIFLHDITRAELPMPSKQNLKIFANICGDNAMKRVALVTTKWDRIPVEEGQGRVEELETAWDSMLHHGASVFHLHAGKSDSKEPHPAFRGTPMDIVNEILSKAGNAFPSLQIQEEMGRHGRSLWETSAGREVPNLLEQEKHLRKHRLFF